MGDWVTISVFLLVSILLSYQYFVYVPYFNPFVSVFWGSLACSYFWVSLNALFMMVMNIYGHIIIMFIGIPIIAGLVKNLREMRIQYLLLLDIDKMKIDSDVFCQIINIQQMIKAANVNQADGLMLVGIVNMHVLDCRANECPCKVEAGLYDASTGKFSQRVGKDYQSRGSRGTSQGHDLFEPLREEVVRKRDQQVWELGDAAHSLCTLSL